MWRKSERRREKIRNRENQKREDIGVRKKKIGRLRNIMFIEYFMIPEGRTIGSLKRRARRQLTK